MTADLAEEHSTATLAAERLDAETSERIRLERELSEVQNKNKTLQQTSERLEMELLYARSDINGVISEEDEEGEGDTSVYKAKYERAVRELEFTRRRLQQQHEDDLEQLVGLKKQLEKKVRFLLLYFEFTLLSVVKRRSQKSLYFSSTISLVNHVLDRFPLNIGIKSCTDSKYF